MSAMPEKKGGGEGTWVRKTYYQKKKSIPGRAS